VIPVDTCAGKNVAVFGLGQNGIATALALMAGGANVSAWDDNKVARKSAAKKKIPLLDLYDADWEGIDLFVPSPGVPLTHPEPHILVKKAKASNIQTVGDAELFAWQLAALPDNKPQPKVIAVTGTNGKSTTTSLIAHVLGRCGFQAAAGGNLGESILSLPALRSDRYYVLELSSYQLDLTHTLKPDVSVFLNISEDHLDRHGGMDGYVRAKQRIFANQDQKNLAIIGVDDCQSQKVCTKISALDGPTVCPISVGKTLGHGAYAIEGILYDGTVRPSAEIIDLRQVDALPGRHNWQNAVAAYAAVHHFVSDDRAIAKSFSTFAGLPHRLEQVRTMGGLTFVNDSKATNAEAASHALATYDNIFWIAGGVAKAGGIDSLSQFFPQIRKAYLIGEAADTFSASLEGQAPYKKCDNLKVAIEKAYTDASAAGLEQAVILLSPACASFDQFLNFEERGEAFRIIVDALKDKKVGKETAA